MPLLTELGAAAPTSGIELHLYIGQFALDYDHHRGGSQGRRQAALEAEDHHAEQPEGDVKQGTKMPVQTIVNNTVSVQFVDAVLELDVTPQITADGTCTWT